MTSKWIMSRQNTRVHPGKRNALQNQTNGFFHGRAVDTERFDFCKAAPVQLGFDMFLFAPPESQSVPSKDLESLGDKGCSNNQPEGTSDRGRDEAQDEERDHQAREDEHCGVCQ